MKVKDCMCHLVYSVLPTTTVCDCARLMEEKHIGCVPVCNCNNEILGLITDRDLILRAIANNKNINDTAVSDLMTTNVCCCDSNTDVIDVQKKMSENQVRRIPIVEDGKVIGIVTLGDLTKNKNINNSEVVSILENICNTNNKNAE